MESFLLPRSLIDYPETTNSQSSQKPLRQVLITGITGQDGLYLTAFLILEPTLPWRYQVHGVVRKNSAGLKILERLRTFIGTTKTGGQIQGAESNIKLHYGDVTDAHFMQGVIKEIQPDEIYNLAAQSQVQHSFFMPQHTADVNYSGLLNICQAVVQLGLTDRTRIFQASTSEMYGQAEEQLKSSPTMDENFPFNPASPYAVAKIAAYYLVIYYRNAYKVKISTGISFNHESPLRHETFITRKITKAVARIKLGLQDQLKLGNLYAKRDWGHARDFVRAFWLINNQDLLTQKNPKFKDYVVATQACCQVKEFLLASFTKAGFTQLEFQGSGLQEKLVSLRDNRVLASIDPQYLRPGEVPHLIGNSSKIKEELKWKPDYSIDALLQEMIEYDLKLAELEIRVRGYAKL